MGKFVRVYTYVCVRVHACVYVCVCVFTYIQQSSVTEHHLVADQVLRGAAGVLEREREREREREGGKVEGGREREGGRKSGGMCVSGKCEVEE